MYCPNCETEVEVEATYDDDNLFKSWICKDCKTTISENHEDNPNKDEKGENDLDR
jgi:transposase-like protein